MPKRLTDKEKIQIVIKFRNDNRLSMYGLGKLLNYSKGVIWRWENGLQKIRPEIISHLKTFVEKDFKGLRVSDKVRNLKKPKSD